MGRKIVVVGDSTSHGGVVISGSPNRFIMGKSIARLGDMVSCPLKYPNKKPHGVNPIIEGEPVFGVNSIPVALHGHKTACGCTLNGSMGPTVGPRGSAEDLAELNKHVYDVPVVLSVTKTKDDEFDQHFQLQDQITGEPLANRHYEIEIAGQAIIGKTDADGFTIKVTANQISDVIIHVLELEHPPINPNWDQ